MSDACETSFHTLAGSLNATAPGSTLSALQTQMLQHGGLWVTSPLTGQRVALQANFLAPQNSMLYCFADRVPFVLVATGLARGNPVCALVTAQGTVAAAAPLLRNARVEALARQVLLDHPAGLPAFDATNGAELVLGNANFAHYLWNEFPTLHAALQRVPDVAVRSLCDPLGATAAFAARHRLPLVQGQPCGDRPLWLARPAVLAGATFCPLASKSALVTLLALPDRPPQDGPLRIYCATRTAGRAATNQNEFLALALRHIAARHPDAAFFLDGFSYPVDFGGSIHDPQRARFIARAAQERAANAAFIAGLGLPQHIEDLTGATTVETLRVIATCHYYITPAGSQQHKAAWFTPLPGFMHGNRTSISTAAVGWLSQQVEGCESPATPEAAMVVDLDVADMPAKTDRNRAYRIADCPGAVDLLLADLAARVPPWPSRTRGAGVAGAGRGC